MVGCERLADLGRSMRSSVTILNERSCKTGRPTGCLVLEIRNATEVERVGDAVDEFNSSELGDLSPEDMAEQYNKRSVEMAHWGCIQK